jgi:hypothetical protein
MAATGFAAAIAFVVWARRVPTPLIDLALFRHRTYRYVNIATLSFGTAFSMMFLALFFYMMNVWHFTLPQAGLAVTPGLLLVMPTAIVRPLLAESSPIPSHGRISRLLIQLHQQFFNRTNRCFYH